jgi:hypothetical protein
MVTGKLESAWRVVARSLSRHLRVPDCFSRAEQERELHPSATKFESRGNTTKLIGCYKA